mmetsp:Transcript_142772/g.455826  ORF Transcript_142772/g.455826 Transcript_142772/m.455826 type:complete len:252 (+) Transcript_142772:3017-3772(+)
MQSGSPSSATSRRRCPPCHVQAMQAPDSGWRRYEERHHRCRTRPSAAPPAARRVAEASPRRRPTGRRRPPWLRSARARTPRGRRMASRLRCPQPMCHERHATARPPHRCPGPRNRSARSPSAGGGPAATANRRARGSRRTRARRRCGRRPTGPGMPERCPKEAAPARARKHLADNHSPPRGRRQRRCGTFRGQSPKASVEKARIVCTPTRCRAHSSSRSLCAGPACRRPRRPRVESGPQAPPSCSAGGEVG